MNKLVKGMVVLGMSMMITTSVFGQITMEEVTKIKESRDNVTVQPINAYIIWKGTREDIKANQIVVEFEVKNDTLADYITPRYLSNERDAEGKIRNVLDVEMTNFYKETLVIQNQHELVSYRSKTEEIKSGEKGKLYTIFWANDQNQSIDVVIGEDIYSLNLTQIPKEVLDLLPIRPVD